MKDGGGITIQVTIPEEALSGIVGEFLREFIAEIQELRKTIQSLENSNQDTINSNESLDGSTRSLKVSVDRLEKTIYDDKLSRLSSRPT